jgi:hypothetical protein
MAYCGRRIARLSIWRLQARRRRELLEAILIELAGTVTAHSTETVAQCSEF